MRGVGEQVLRCAVFENHAQVHGRQSLVLPFARRRARVARLQR